MTNKGAGGRGGDATVSGDDSTAEGGQGGDAVIGDGGAGGQASVAADRSHAIGGRGGRGGIGPGGPGGDVHILPEGTSWEELISLGKAPPIGPSDTYLSTSDGRILLLARGGQNGNDGSRGGGGFAIGNDTFAAGGQGGEASQPDGRGGRGGRAHGMDESLGGLGKNRRAYMRRPYYESINEPGRGGDAPDTPQYKARRLIVEQIKQQRFAQLGLPLSEAWWDREIVPIDWINKQLMADRHRWSVMVVDDEYEFTDSTP